MEQDKLFELEKNMEKIQEAMNLSRKRDTKIKEENDKLNEETRIVKAEELKEEISNLKKEKKEFDEMTVNSLINAKRDIRQEKEKLENDYQKKLVEYLEKKNEIEAKLAKMKQNNSEKETLETAEKAANKTKLKLETDLLNYKNDHEKNMNNLTKWGEEITNYSIELDVMERVDKESAKDYIGKDETKGPEKQDYSSEEAKHYEELAKKLEEQAKREKAEEISEESKERVEEKEPEKAETKEPEKQDYSNEETKHYEELAKKLEEQAKRETAEEISEELKEKERREKEEKAQKYFEEVIKPSAQSKKTEEHNNAESNNKHSNEEEHDNAESNNEHSAEEEHDNAESNNEHSAEEKDMEENGAADVDPYDAEEQDEEDLDEEELDEEELDEEELDEEDLDEEELEDNKKGKEGLLKRLFNFIKKVFKNLFNGIKGQFKKLTKKDIKALEEGKDLSKADLYIKDREQFRENLKKKDEHEAEQLPPLPENEQEKDILPEQPEDEHEKENEDDER